MGINGEYLTMAQACGEAPVHPRGYVASEGAVLPPEPPVDPEGMSERERRLLAENRKLRDLLIEHDVDPGGPLYGDFLDDPEDEGDYRPWVNPDEM